ncbi:hypothetical protein PR048_010779, partial [Dryococelus australis]
MRKDTSLGVGGMGVSPNLVLGPSVPMWGGLHSWYNSLFQWSVKPRQFALRMGPIATSNESVTMYLTIQSLINIRSVSLFITDSLDSKPDVIVVAETWLVTNLQILDFRGMTAVLHVITMVVVKWFYIKSNLKHKLLDTLDNTHYSIWIEVNIGSNGKTADIVTRFHH